MRELVTLNLKKKRTLIIHLLMCRWRCCSNGCDHLFHRLCTSMYSVHHHNNNEVMRGRSPILKICCVRSEKGILIESKLVGL